MRAKREARACVSAYCHRIPRAVKTASRDAAKRATHCVSSRAVPQSGAIRQNNWVHKGHVFPSRCVRWVLPHVLTRSGGTALRRFYLVFLVLALVVTPLSVRPAHTVAQATGTACADSEEAAFLQLINDYRAEKGIGPLALSQSLSVAADAHSRDMATNDFFSHTGFNGSTFIDRLTAAGYPDPFSGAENIAAGTPTGAGAIETWKNSPPKRGDAQSEFQSDRHWARRQPQLEMEVVLDHDVWRNSRWRWLFR